MAWTMTVWLPGQDNTSDLGKVYGMGLILEL